MPDYPPGTSPLGLGKVPEWAREQTGSPFAENGPYAGFPLEGAQRPPVEKYPASSFASPGGEPPGGAPPGAFPPSPERAEPAQEIRPEKFIEFWGAISPVKQNVWWDGDLREVVYHLLTTEEEKWISSEVLKSPKGSEVMLEGQLRAALSVRSVSGREVNYPLHQKIEWVKSWPGALLDAVLVGYEFAVRVPLQSLQGYISDPNSEAALSWNGEDSEGAGISTDERSAPMSGPS